MNEILEKRINDIISRFEHKNWIIKIKNVNSIMQNGPQCGIVGLCMGLNFLNLKLNVNELMKQAIDSGFTKNGEIFDIDYLHSLGKNYVENLKIIELNTQNDEILLLKAILNSKLALIAYDCDFNFEPCRKNGLKAHWALIIGFLIPDCKENGSINLNEEKSLTSEEINQNKLFLKFDESLDKHKLDSLILNFSNLSNEIFVICKHGKSKHSAVWNYKSLIQSNSQLLIVDDEKCKIEEFVRPLDGNIQKGLASKVLIFS